MDVTERRRAEEEHQAHLWFLESMDWVNRAMQGTNDLEQMMSDVLDVVLSVFNCDPSQGGSAVYVGAASMLVPASLDTAGRAALPGDRPTAGGRPDQFADVSRPGRKRAQTRRGPTHLARRLLGARSRDQSLHLVGRKLPHLWTAAPGT